MSKSVAGIKKCPKQQFFSICAFGTANGCKLFLNGIFWGKLLSKPRHLDIVSVGSMSSQVSLTRAGKSEYNTYVQHMYGQQAVIFKIQLDQ
jgi:hypothetical protein